MTRPNSNAHPTIGGQHGHELYAALSGRSRDRLDYAQRAQTHRPAEADQLSAEVHRLAATGLTTFDIAQALRLAPDAVRAVLGPDHKSNHRRSP